MRSRPRSGVQRGAGRGTGSERAQSTGLDSRVTHCDSELRIGEDGRSPSAAIALAAQTRYRPCLVAVVSAAVPRAPARDERRDRLPDGAVLLPCAGCDCYARARATRATFSEAIDIVMHWLHHAAGTPPSSRTRGLAFTAGDVAAIGLDWVPRPISVPNRTAKVRK
jgi:hypothetical protein